MAMQGAAWTISTAALVVAAAAAWVGRAPAPERLAVDPIAGQHRASFILTKLLRSTPVTLGQDEAETLASAKRWAAAAEEGQVIGLFPSDLSDQDSLGARAEIFETRMRLQGWLLSSAREDLAQGQADAALEKSVLALWVAQAGKSSSWSVIADSGQLQVRALRVMEDAIPAASPETLQAAADALSSPVLQADPLEPLDRHLAILTAGDFAAAALDMRRPETAAEQASLGVRLHRSDVSAFQPIAKKGEAQFQAERERVLSLLTADEKTSSAR
jgi:hypothetical protein